MAFLSSDLILETLESCFDKNRSTPVISHLIFRFIETFQVFWSVYAQIFNNEKNLR